MLFRTCRCSYRLLAIEHVGFGWRDQICLWLLQSKQFSFGKVVEGDLVQFSKVSHVQCCSWIQVWDQAVEIVEVLQIVLIIVSFVRGGNWKILASLIISVAFGV